MSLSSRVALGAALVTSVVVGVACSSPSSKPAPGGVIQIGVEDGDALGRDIPCDAREVLRTICQQCHTNPPINGAPFPLIRRQHLSQMQGGERVRDLMIEQLEARRMPLAPVTIGDDEREALLSWLKAGAPAAAISDCREATASDAGEDVDATSSDESDVTDAGTDSTSHSNDDGGDAASDATPE